MYATDTTITVTPGAPFTVDETPRDDTKTVAYATDGGALYRATLTLDADEMSADWCGSDYAAVVGYRGSVDTLTVSDCHCEDCRHRDGMAGALLRFVGKYGGSDGVTVWERYARIFHGLATFTVSGWHYGNDADVVVSCLPEHRAGAYAVWRAIADGEVYGVTVERADDATVTPVRDPGSVTVTGYDVDPGAVSSWTPTVDGSVWGVIGEDAATETAADMLADHLTTVHA